VAGYYFGFAAGRGAFTSTAATVEVATPRQLVFSVAFTHD
jgi:hypothetical protein